MNYILLFICNKNVVEVVDDMFLLIIFMYTILSLLKPILFL
jgi:hypothetical protein